MFDYDQYNRLTTEAYPQENKAFILTYDNGGNIKTRNEYSLTTGALVQNNSWNYSNLIWRDILTSTTGKYAKSNIAYDMAGNPKIYGSMTMDWQNGKQLKTLTKASYNGYNWGNLAFEYDYNGMRTKKIRTDGQFGYVDNYYYWQGSRLLAENHGGTLLWFYYDETGISGMNKNGVDYYFEKNTLNI